jgi:hypothetical protein
MISRQLLGYDTLKQNHNLVMTQLMCNVYVTIEIELVTPVRFG